tara:strand:- start:414 stop:725 length:312 start_codon:yes stop_codon:yes gene_type:complete
LNFVIISIIRTKPVTPVLLIAQNREEMRKFECCSPSDGCSISPKKKEKWTKRTIEARTYLSDIEAKDGLPTQMGVSDSVISGNASLTDDESISNRYLSIYSDM